MSTTVQRVVRAAIPDATEEACLHVLWAHTPFPFRPVQARELFKAAHRLRRAADKGVRLCEFCERSVPAGTFTCERCAAALNAEPQP